MSQTPREVRQMVRDSRRLVNDVSHCHQETNDVKDDYIKHLEARCELQEKALKESQKLVELYATKGDDREQAYKDLIEHQKKTIADLSFKATVRLNMLEMQEKILVRAFHLELRAEYRSLDFPPTPNEYLPPLTFRQWCHWSNIYGWCTNEDDQEKIVALQKKYFDHAESTGDFRIPSVRALFNNVPVPHPPGIEYRSRPECYKNPNIEFRHLAHLPVDTLPDSPLREDYWHRSRSRSPPPSRGKEPASAPDADATVAVESSEDEEYWLESRGDGSGPSSARG